MNTCVCTIDRAEAEGRAFLAGRGLSPEEMSGGRKVQWSVWGAGGNVVSRVWKGLVRAFDVRPGAMTMYCKQEAPQPGFKQRLGESPSFSLMNMHRNLLNYAD